MKGRLERTALTHSHCRSFSYQSRPWREGGGQQECKQTILDSICIDTWFPLKVALSERCKDHKNANGSQQLPESELSGASPPPYHKSKSDVFV